VANIRSATDVEQLLGRVMRMPYAKRRKVPELNNAYAHVISTSFAEAADGMHSRLVNMGFHETEAAENILPEQLTLPGVDIASMPLFRVAGQEPSRVPPLVIDLPQAPVLDAVPEEVRATVSVTKNADGTAQIVCSGMISEELEEAIVAAAPKLEEDNRRKVAIQRARIHAAQPPAPSQQGGRFNVPRLMVEIWGSLEILESETILVATNWSPKKYSIRMEPGEFDYDETAHTFIFDLEGERMRYEEADAQVQFSLLATPVEWDALKLSRWLDRQCRQDDVRQVDMLEFCRLSVASLLERKTFGLPTLCRAKYALAAALKAKISRLRQRALAEGYQHLLFAPGAKVETSFDYGHSFPEAGYAENIPAYKGFYRFKKHFYPVPRDLKSKGEEFDCARLLDSNPKVRWWVRNVDRQAGSFWLPLSKGKFYPDFVAQLEDNRILVVEYKGAHLSTADEAKEKLNVGELWEEKSGGRGRFLMAKLDAEGVSLSQQIKTEIG
jgi:type III restriction enzyme